MNDSKVWLSQDIEFLKGVGPVRGDLLRKEIAIHRFEDLLHYYPFRYIDKSQIQKIVHLTSDGETVQIKGRLVDLHEIKAKKKRLEAYISDGSGTIKLVWFQKINWILKALTPGKEYLIFGRLNKFGQNFSIVHPEMELAEKALRADRPVLDPVYSSTEKLTQHGLDAKGIRKLMHNLFDKLNPHHVEENLPDYLLKKLKLPGRYQSLRWLHIPSSPEELERAKMRLKFEELFFLQLRILYRRKKHQNFKGYAFSEVGEYFNSFYQNHLTFELTNAQKRVLREIRSDLGGPEQMNRLLQGDVGSGKTVVSVMSMLLALDNGFQSCLLAPTEVLAKQHFDGIQSMLAPLGIKVDFLSGSIKGKKRKEVLTSLEEGHTHIIIGTHAILEPKVHFKNLGLAITDEQHRFGVKQRASLWTKSRPHPPHILVMTATPIPRTLAMTLYGDLNVSVIDEMPPGRKQIVTSHRREKHRGQLYKFMREQIAMGRQIFVVYPLIEESATLDLQNLMDGYEQLTEVFPNPEYRISVVHGRMTSEEKDKEMQRFVEKKTQIMVATTVIEVGVNVPNATVMVIENAERFGLSQLHQLRGRVGRGGDQAYCILMTGEKLGQDAVKRMQTMSRTNDGFEIAEVDLEIRGPGDIEGTQQSGLMDLKIANIVSDVRMIETARQIVLKILDHDPDLTRQENTPLFRFLARDKQLIEWGKIG